MMSQMDGLTKVDLGAHTCELVTKCINMGYRGVAITDHDGCQAFPIAYQLIKKHNSKIEDKDKKFKGLYGTELTLVEEEIDIVPRSDNRPFKGTTCVVFDTETTGFNAATEDQMIEIGAVKLKDGEILDRFDEFINPHRKLNKKITELTHITDKMLESARDEKDVVKEKAAALEDLDLIAGETVQGKLATLRFWWACASSDYYYSYKDKLAQVSQEDAIAFVKKYIDGKNPLVTVVLSPSYYESQKDDFESKGFELITEKNAFWQNDSRYAAKEVNKDELLRPLPCDVYYPHEQNTSESKALSSS